MQNLGVKCWVEPEILFAHVITLFSLLFFSGNYTTYLPAKFVHKHVRCILILDKKFGNDYLTESSSNDYACVKISKCHTEVICGYNCWYFYWSLFLIRLGSGKNLRPINTVELPLDFDLVICDSSLSKLLFLIHVREILVNL